MKNKSLFALSVFGLVLVTLFLLNKESQKAVSRTPSQVQSEAEAKPWLSSYDLLQNISLEEFNLSEAINSALQAYNMNHLQKGEKDKKTQESLAQLQQLIAQYKLKNTKQNAPAWSANNIQLPDGEEIHLDETWAKFVATISGERKIQKEDLSIIYPWSEHNEMKVLADREIYWPALLKDLSEARKSIHIQMFGFQNHQFTREMVEILKTKAREGVEVRVILDQWGARMHKKQGRLSESLIQEMRDTGIETLVTFDPRTKGWFHMDHRKIYVIDGKIGITTGYTIEDHMRNDYFDVGIRTTGELVAQIQMNFLLSFLYFGGTLNAAEGADALVQNFFPAPEVTDANAQRAKVTTNVPGVAHGSTQTYYELLSKDSTAPIHIINPFISDSVLMNLLISEAKKGRIINIYTGQQAENFLYNHNTRRQFDILSAAGVRCYYYHGPDLRLHSHAKAVLLEGEIGSVGSTNLDSFSLFHNYEQNLVSDDAKFVEDLKENVFDYVQRYSKLHVPTKGFFPKLKLKIKSFPGSAVRFILGNKNGKGYKRN